MVKLGLVRLDFCEVAVVEVSGVFELVVLEDDDSASLIADGKIFPCLIISDCSEQIVFGHVLLVALTEPVDVDPVA